MQTMVDGVVVKGYRVASGPSRDYPYGTLEKQIPLFKERGLDLGGFYFGTLNISIAPLTFEMVAPTYTFRQVHWTDLHPPEDFSFSPCRIMFKNCNYGGYIYYPHPETKKRHFENASILEVIAVYIKGIQYGDHVQITVKPEQVRIIST